MLQLTLMEIIEGKKYDRCEVCEEILDSLDRCGCDYNP